MAGMGGFALGSMPMGGGTQTVFTPGFTQTLKSLYPDSHNVEGPVYSAILSMLGSRLDAWDPYRLGVPNDFCVTTSSGIALDRNGTDWGVIRRAGEADPAYRARILAALALYAQGSTIAGITAALTPYTGTAPVIVDNCTDGYIMGTATTASTMGQAAMGSPAWYFSITVYVQNPGSLPYSHYDFENTVKQGLPARAQAHVYHNGADTSVLDEASNAIVTITG